MYFSNIALVRQKMSPLHSSQPDVSGDPLRVSVGQFKTISTTVNLSWKWAKTKSCSINSRSVSKYVQLLRYFRQISVFIHSFIILHHDIKIEQINFNVETAQTININNNSSNHIAWLPVFFIHILDLRPKPLLVITQNNN